MGYQPVAASFVGEALVALERSRFVCRTVPSGDEALKQLYAEGAKMGAVAMFSDRSEVSEELARASVHRGAGSPLKPEELPSETAVVATPPPDDSSPQSEDARLSHEIDLCCSPKMREVWEIVRQAAGVDVTVLVCGETGTGKDLVARAIHQLSSRRHQPFVKVNCAAVPRELLESELFGHERGAFTGAHQLKIGKFESANHGTVFLDEIGDLHQALQAKLLHVLQDGTFSRVGGKSSIKVDVRIVAATNQNLERAVLSERFREDLYYRLNVIQITVPPLRERIEELPALAEYFIQRYSKLLNRPRLSFGPPAMDRLMQYRYPGNVRELENVVKRMIVLNDPLLTRIPLEGTIAGTTSDDGGVGTKARRGLKEIGRTAARAAEREAIDQALRQTNWNRVKAARILRISYRALLYKIKEARLDGGWPSVRPAK